MTDAKVHSDYYESSGLAKFPFQPYHPDAKLKVRRAGRREEGGTCGDLARTNVSGILLARRGVRRVLCSILYGL